MPPLCAIELGIALRRADVWGGAGLLFFTNLVAISFVGIVMFVPLGFRPRRSTDGRELYASGASVLLVTVPLVILTTGSVGQARQARAIEEAVEVAIVSLSHAELIGVQTSWKANTLNLRVTVRNSQQPIYGHVVELQAAIARRLQRPVALVLVDVPTITLTPLIPPTWTPTNTPTPTATSTATATSTPMPTLAATATATSTQPDAYAHPDADHPYDPDRSLSWNWPAGNPRTVSIHNASQEELPHRERRIRRTRAGRPLEIAAALAAQVRARL